MPISFPYSNSQTMSQVETRQSGFMSGRKSPDPFKRFRRLSSTNSLNILPDMESLHISPNPSSSPVDPTVSRSPPPKPSSSTKPLFVRNRKTKAASISILGAAISSKPNPSGPTSENKKGHQTGPSAPALGSDPSVKATIVNESSPASSPEATLSYLATPANSAKMHSPMPSPARQHIQAWYQAQQKTIELDQPERANMPTSSAPIFPINVTAPVQLAKPGSKDVRVETFMSEEEIVAAGVQIIRRRDGDGHQRKPSSTSTNVAHESIQPPHMPARLPGANDPDFLELLDSRSNSADPGAAQSLFSGESPVSSSLSLVPNESPLSSVDHLSASGHKSAKSSLDKERSAITFSFTKRRKPGSRPSTADSNYVNHSISSISSLSGSDSAAPPVKDALPAYLNPSPSTSAYPFLNKHSATVGKATGFNATTSVRSGLANLYHSAATLSSSPTERGDENESTTEIKPPPKPPKLKPSLLKAFPHRTTASSGPNSAATDTDVLLSSAKIVSSRWIDNQGISYPDPPRSALASTSSRLTVPDSGPYLTPTHSRSYDQVVNGSGQQLSVSELEALRSSAGTPLPPPPRRHDARLGGSSFTAGLNKNGSNHTSGGGVAGALGQIGVAVGKRGWDFMKTFNTGSSSTSSSRVGNAGRSEQAAVGHSSNLKNANKGSRSYLNRIDPFPNEATRQWLAASEEGPKFKLPPGKIRSVAISPPIAASLNTPVFGTALRQVVLRTRLCLRSNVLPVSNNDQPDHGGIPATHLSIPDLGSEFSLGMSFIESPASPVSVRTSVASKRGDKRAAVTRYEARMFYLPGVVVRCIESLEKWGPQEEGIYRLSGRSSHTAKLRAIFEDSNCDLNLQAIGPADLDINSVCSVLKSYLRELPDSLIPASMCRSLENVGYRIDNPMTSTNRPFQRDLSNPPSPNPSEAANVNFGESEVLKQLQLIVQGLHAVNWYLLRELAEHLGWLSSTEIASKTKMTLSNLCLVLAPTLSLSVLILRLLVEKRSVIFSETGPEPDAELDAAVCHLDSQVNNAVNDPPPPTTAVEQPSTPLVNRGKDPKEKPSKFPSPSKLPTLVRKRASSIGLGALLSDRSNNKFLDRVPSIKHRTTNSSVGVDESSSSRSIVVDSPPPRSPYMRPNTSLGHYQESSTFGSDRGQSLGLGVAPVAPPRSHSREEATRFNALALDTSLTSLQSGPSQGLNALDRMQKKEATDADDHVPPIARYFSRMRQEAHSSQRNSMLIGNDLQSPTLSVCSQFGDSALSSPTIAQGSTPVHRFWAEKVEAEQDANVRVGRARSGTGTSTGALDRPRPPTSGSSSFFSGRTRRNESVAGLGGFVITPKHIRGASRSSAHTRNRETVNEGDTHFVSFGSKDNANAKRLKMDNTTMIHSPTTPTGIMPASAWTAATESAKQEEKADTATTALVHSIDSSMGETRPFTISRKTNAVSTAIRRSPVSKKPSMITSSFSANTISAFSSNASSTHDTPRTMSLEHMRATQPMNDSIVRKPFENKRTGDVRSEIEQYLGLGRVVDVESRRRALEESTNSTNR